MSMPIKAIAMLLATSFFIGCHVPDSSRLDHETGGGDHNEDETGAPRTSALAEVIEGGVQVCEQPALRASDGPMARWEGPGWDSQQVVEATDGLTRYGWGVSLGDVDGDSRVDIFLPGERGSQLFFNTGADFELVENLLESHVARPVGDEGAQGIRSIGSVTVDIEGDGDLDILVATDQGPALFRNDGTALSNATAKAGLQGLGLNGYGYALADFDRDGDLDILAPSFCCSGGVEEENLPPGEPSSLLENMGDGTFIDATHLLPEETNIGYSFVAGWTDHDRDGWPDIHLTCDHGRTVMPNRLWRNDGGQGFIDVSEETGLALAISAMGLGIGDVNGDRYPDYLVTNVWDTHLLESAGSAVWYQTEVVRQIQPNLERSQDVGWGAELADMDNDGLLDAVVMFGFWLIHGVGEAQPDALYLNRGETFEDVAVSWGMDDIGYGRGLALADLNGDGWLDVVKRELFAPAKIYLSRCGEASWLRVQLSQPGKNPDAIGGEIIVEAGEAIQRRWISAGGTGLSSSNPAEAHFGLGEAEVVDSLTVVWPDGQRSSFVDLIPRQVITVQRNPQP